jgi:hypothetical protein
MRSLFAAAAIGLFIPIAADAGPLHHGQRPPICFPDACPNFGYTPPTWRVWPEPPVEYRRPPEPTLPMPRPGTGPDQQPRELLPPPDVSPK